MVCLDTDVIIHFLRKNKEAVELMEKIIATKEKISTTSINEFELWKGVYRLYGKKRENSLRQFLSQVHRFGFDDKASKKAALVFENLRKKGDIIDALDIMIASIAIVNNESILTLNKKHFERIKGLRVI